MQHTGRLFRKYALVLALLVGGALVASGAVQLAFSFQESRAALGRLEREKAVTAATRIEEFVREIEQQMSWVLEPASAIGPADLDRRYADELRLMGLVPAITQVEYVDASGRQQLLVRRLASDVLRSGMDRSADPTIAEARSNRTASGALAASAYSAVTFRNGTEPYMTIARAEPGPAAGVTAIDVNLKFIYDVVSQIQVGDQGHAYVVDRAGTLIAHPDISLVLRVTDFSQLPQVQAARSGAPNSEGLQGRDANGQDVLTAYEPIPTLDWFVFVEEPLAAASAPLYASAARSVALVALGILLAIAASLYLARRMVRPVQALRASAARIGAGALDEPIAVRSGDELEDLADAFDGMRARLRESYESLEKRVIERTKELSLALEQQTATADVLRAISGSPTELQPVLDAITANASRFCRAEDVTVALIEGDQLRLRAHFGSIDPSLVEWTLDRDSVTGRAVLEGRTIEVGDLQAADAEFPVSARVARQAGHRTILATPLVREDRAIGCIFLRRPDIRRFTTVEIDLVENFAAQAVIAIENVRLFIETKEKSGQLEIANQELAAASRHKSEFLANMSHELRTPLNAIIGFSDVLEQRLFGQLNERQADYTRDIASSGRHLLDLVNEILDLSKVEAGRMELEPNEFALGDTIHGALAFIRERAASHRIALTAEIPADLGTIVADERKVRQVLLNLLSNAVKFTPDGGTITVQAHRGEGEVQVSVSDTGIGIAPEDQAKVFDEFQQVGKASDRSREGTGLGLTLAKRFIELHGGRIWVESAVGAGTTFTFAIPRGLAPTVR